MNIPSILYTNGQLTFWFSSPSLCVPPMPQNGVFQLLLGNGFSMATIAKTSKYTQKPNATHKLTCSAACGQQLHVQNMLL